METLSKKPCCQWKSSSGLWALLYGKLSLNMLYFRGTWVAPSVKWQTLDFGSGHNLTVYGFEPHVRLCAVGTEPVWDSLSPFLSALLCP